jgi:hypothetical protein
MSTASPRPQLNPDEMRRLKWLLGGLVALVSLCTVFFLDVEARSLVGFAGLLILGALVWPQLPAHIPALLWRLSVPAIVVAVVADFYFSKDTLPALIRLDILLVLYRAVSYRRKREDLQLIVLGLFLIVVAGVLTVSLGFAFLLLLFTACALGFLFSVTLIDMTDTGPKVMRPEEMREVPAWARLGWGRFFVRLRQVADWRLIGFAAGLFVLVVGFSSVLFLAIPRFELGSSFFLDKYITRKARTGFSETIKFGEVSELVRDESMAIRVDLTDAASVREPPYFRLIVLDEYTKQGFQMSARLQNKLRVSARAVRTVPGREALRSSAMTVGGVWTIYLEPEASRFLPLPGSFGQLRLLREQMPLQISKEQQLIALGREPMSMVPFSLEGVSLGSTIADADFARTLEQHFSKESPKGYDPRITLHGPDGPENEAALKRIVDEISAGTRLEAAVFAPKATDWLRAKHSYALSSRIPGGPKEKDDIVKWLESNEPGFCEYFAAGLTVLCRAAGHPARVVSGYHGWTLNEFQNYFMVKNSNAHAWAEVFDGKKEWFRADATPGATNPFNPGAANAFNPEQEMAAMRQLKSDRSWTARFDSLRVIWYRHIVNFDAQQQVAMIEDVKSFTTDTGAVLRKRLEALTVKLKAWLAGPWDFARIGNFFQLVAALVLMAWAALRGLHWSRLAWRMWREPGNYDPVRSEAGRWLGKLSPNGGRAAGPDETLEHVRSELLRLRYGRRETWPEPREVFHRARKAGRAARANPRKAAAEAE